MDGFDLFCPGHLVIIAALPAAAICLGIICKRMSETASCVFIRTLSVLVLLCETLQDILLTLEGGNILNYLPLHLCNLGIFVNMAASFGCGKVRAFFSEVSLTLIAPGALFAVITPDWNYRPLLSWLPLMCFFTHILFVIIPVLMLIRGYCRPSFRHFHYAFIFLIAAAVPIYILDKAINRNYMYLLWPASDSPLEWLESFMGNPGYLLGVLIMLAVILAVIYTLLWLIRPGQNRDTI
ncbi:MAG: YwaF family protein [Clostridiales bacterium]|nr:YwaF family protein [Clostridiales bacterium]